MAQADTAAGTAANKRPTLLLVDDDSMITATLTFVLKEHFSLVVAESRPAAIELCQAQSQMPALALVDLGLAPNPHLPDEGFALISELLQRSPDMRILVLSGQSDQANVSHALSLGAADFIAKPCDPGTLISLLDQQAKILEAEQAQSQSDVERGSLIGNSAPVLSMLEQVSRFASTPFPILISGESGTGKELVAELIAGASGGSATKPASASRVGLVSDQAANSRSTAADTPESAATTKGSSKGSAKGSLTSVNCAAIPPDLLEAQLFGHSRGAFTGASGQSPGFFGEAEGGTLFLDEIGEFPLELQPKLLRVLESGEYYRVGETKARTSTARIITATNRDLQAEIRAGRFRQDLFHRLSVLTIVVPPLRVRGDDVLQLLQHFQQYYAEQIAPFSLDEAAIERWRTYSFPGNVRELRNIVIRLGAKYPAKQIGLNELEPELDAQEELSDATIEQLSIGGFNLDKTLSAWEQRYIKAALKMSGGNLSEAARLLGVNRTTLYSKIQRLSLAESRDV